MIRSSGKVESRVSECVSDIIASLRQYSNMTEANSLFKRIREVPSAPQRIDFIIYLVIKYSLQYVDEYETRRQLMKRFNDILVETRSFEEFKRVISTLLGETRWQEILFKVAKSYFSFIEDLTDSFNRVERSVLNELYSLDYWYLWAEEIEEKLDVSSHMAAHILSSLQNDQPNILSTNRYLLNLSLLRNSVKNEISTGLGDLLSTLETIISYSREEVKDKILGEILAGITRYLSTTEEEG